MFRAVFVRHWHYCTHDKQRRRGIVIVEVFDVTKFPGHVFHILWPDPLLFHVNGLQNDHQSVGGCAHVLVKAAPAVTFLGHILAVEVVRERKIKKRPLYTTSKT